MQGEITWTNSGIHTCHMLNPTLSSTKETLLLRPVTSRIFAPHKIVQWVAEKGRKKCI